MRLKDLVVYLMSPPESLGVGPGLYLHFNDVRQEGSLMGFLTSIGISMK